MTMEVMKCLLLPPPGRQLPVVKLNPSRVQPNITLQDLNNEHPLQNVGSIGCFVHYRNGGQIKRVWGITAGHLLVERGDCRCQEGDCIVAQSGLDPLVKLSDSYFASKKNTEVNGENRFVDVGVFQIHIDEMIRLYGQNWQAFLGPPVFCSGDENLFGKIVTKTGQTSGTTYGKIIDCDVNFVIDDEMRLGLFVVESTQQYRPFAEQGDSGAAVVDQENQQVVGLVCAVLEYYDKLNKHYQWVRHKWVTLCVRLDHALQYVKKCEKEVNCSCQRDSMGDNEDNS